MRSEGGESTRWHSALLMAAKAYNVRDQLGATEVEWLDAWRFEVWRHLKERSPAYRRPDAFNRVLDLLFPAIAPMPVSTAQWHGGNPGWQARALVVPGSREGLRR
jgi:hypothetical protein